MVALLETFALEKPDSETKNRVGDFFSRSADRAGENSSLTLIVVRKTGLSNYDACRAASLTQGRDRNANGRSKINLEKRRHFARNKLNLERISEIFGPDAVGDPNFVFTEEMLVEGQNLESLQFRRASNEENMFHRFGPGNEGNVKYLSLDGRTYGRVELILNTDMQLVLDPLNMGTYNYGGNAWTHYWKDVVPWIKYGNSPDDPTTRKYRSEQFWNAVKDKF